MPIASLPVTGNTEHTSPENRAYFPALDGLRAVAFLMVFFQHYEELPWGWAGVDLFFVLSGFLITGILFDSRDDPHRVRNFYVRRTLRIFPLYYGVLLLLVVLWPLFHWQRSWLWLVWPSYMGNFLQNIFHGHTQLFETVSSFQPTGVIRGHHFTLYLGHLWSLCVEEQFYMFWPAVVFLVRSRRSLLWICAASVPACLTARMLVNHFVLPPPQPGWEYTFTPIRIDALLIGGLLALALRGPQSLAIKRAGRIAFPITLALVALYAVMTPLHHVFTQPYPYPQWMYSVGVTGIDIVSALCILVTIQPGSWTYRALNSRPLRALGALTYGAYVFHDIPHVIYGALAKKVAVGHEVIATTIFALIGTYTLAWLSFRFFESRFLNLKERFTIKAARPL